MIHQDILDVPDRLINCPDCGVKPGYQHHYGCEVEICTICGKQCWSTSYVNTPSIHCGCEDHDPNNARWSGTPNYTPEYLRWCQLQALEYQRVLELDAQFEAERLNKAKPKPKVKAPTPDHCTVDNCMQPVHNKQFNYCRSHYYKQSHYGDPLYAKK